MEQFFLNTPPQEVASQESPTNVDEGILLERKRVEQLLIQGNVRKLPEPIRSLDDSQNTVEQVAVSADDSHFNNADLYVIEGDNKQEILALFKPFSGENTQTKIATMIPAFFVREILVARIAEHVLNFTITPPIVFREINGEIGTLQQYISDEQFKTPHRLLEEDQNAFQQLDAVEESEDAERLAVLDFICASGPDRHTSNWLINTSYQKTDDEVEKKEPQKALYAIDNAVALRTTLFATDSQVQGPAFTFTAVNTPQGTIAKPERVPICEAVASELEDALSRWDSFFELLDVQLMLDIEDNYIKRDHLKNFSDGTRSGREILLGELEHAKQRHLALLHAKHHLSRANIEKKDFMYPEREAIQLEKRHPLL